MDLQLDHEYTINPDGSGRASIRWEGPSPGDAFEPGAFIAGEVTQSKGIDAWESVTCAQENGRLVFQAVVYFKELAKLRFHCQGLHTNTLDFDVSQDDKGNVTVASQGGPKARTDGTPEASDDEIRARLAEEREKFEQMRGFISEFIGGLRCRATIHLPGKLGSVVNGKKKGESAVRTEFEGDQIMKILERMMSDDELAIKVIRGGAEDPQAVLAALGDNGPLTATTKGKVAPAFDYEAAVAAAREKFEALLPDLKLPRGPEKGPPMANARIVAAKIVREADGDRDLNPMGQNYPSISFTICGDLPGPALKADEGRIDAAIVDTGENLAPDDDWKKRINFPKLTKDRRSVYFDIDLPLPPEGATGFREIRGMMSCRVASGSEDIDLGLSSLEPGTEGKALGARIERFESDEDRHTLELRVALPREQVEAVALLDGPGNATPLDENGYSAVNDEVTFTYGFRGELPEKPRLVARIAKNLQTYEVSFVIENVDLAGRPRG